MAQDEPVFGFGVFLTLQAKTITGLGRKHESRWGVFNDRRRL